MDTLTTKGEIVARVEICLDALRTEGIQACVKALEREILNQKIKFPLLEFCGTELFDILRSDDQIPFCDEIEKLKTIGGNVLIGVILQKRLPANFEASIQKAADYVSMANGWWVCDIIGERVFGSALRASPELAIQQLKKLTTHPSRWVVRSLGAGFHHAIKKGLDKNHCETIFQVLLSLADSKDKEIKQGVGWAAKTTAKFHPEIINSYAKELESEKVGQWFRGKVKIGLARHQYAAGNRG